MPQNCCSILSLLKINLVFIKAFLLIASLVKRYCLVPFGKSGIATELLCCLLEFPPFYLTVRKEIGDWLLPCFSSNLYFCWYREIDSGFVHLPWHPTWLVIKQLFCFYPGLNKTRIWKGRCSFSLCLFFTSCHGFQSHPHYCFVIVQSPDFRIQSLSSHFCRTRIYFFPLSPVTNQFC